MSQADSIRQALIKTEYEPVSSSRKLQLLLQRSVRYSYRQRCCGCCPTILCELLFPFIITMILLLSRYGINRLAVAVDSSDGRIPGTFGQRPCSQNLNILPTSSNDIFAKCFKFPPSYSGDQFGSSKPHNVSNTTNIVFQPNRTDVIELVQQAAMRLNKMNCSTTTKVW
jgi:hypothetical protein